MENMSEKLAMSNNKHTRRNGKLSHPYIQILSIYASNEVWMEGYLQKSSPDGLGPFSRHPTFPSTWGYESRILGKFMSRVASKELPKCGDIFLI